jgi:hypothetical protein
LERLNTELKFGAVCGGTGLGSGGDVGVVAAGAARSKISFEREGAGGFGCDTGEVSFWAKLKSRPFEETEAVLTAAGFEAGLLEAILSKRPPPLIDLPGEVTLEAARGDFGLVKPLRPAKTSMFWDFGGG